MSHTDSRSSNITVVQSVTPALRVAKIEDEQGIAKASQN
jgi:hypothetical protein